MPVTRVALHDRPIDASALLREVESHAAGATVLFLGTVREHNVGRAVTGIDYSAYQGMAERVLAAITHEATTRFGALAVVAEHRLGFLALGETSVAIAVAHERRAGAYDASRYVIEELKRRVPVWKREHYVDGTREWVDPTGSQGSDRAGNGSLARSAALYPQHSHGAPA